MRSKAVVLLSVLLCLCMLSMFAQDAMAERCSNCGGTGDCPQCRGDGSDWLTTCSVCKGDGRCQECGGDGEISISEGIGGLPGFELPLILLALVGSMAIFTLKNKRK